MEKSKQGGDTWISLMAEGLTSPPLILVKIMPLLNFSFREHSWLGYLIKDAYLHDDKTQYVCCMPRHTIGDNFNLKHSITNQ